MFRLFPVKVKPKSKPMPPLQSVSLPPKESSQILPKPEKMGPACKFLQRMLMSAGSSQGRYTKIVTYSPLSTLTGGTDNQIADPQVFLANMKLLFMAMFACQEERRAESLGCALPPSSAYFAQLEAQCVAEEQKVSLTGGSKPA